MIGKIIYVVIALVVILYFTEPINFKIKRLHLLSPPLRKLSKLSQQDVFKGKVEMSKHKVVVCGITRDNGKDLPHTIKHIENTTKLFKDYRVIIFENDSTDTTKQILKRWAATNNKVKILMEDYGLVKRPSIPFLAQIRNFYLEELDRKAEYKDFDIIMIVDLDMKYGWHLKGIENSFNRIKEWDVVCSNGIYTSSGHMWDMFAFRNEEFPENHLNKNYWSKIVPAGQKIYDVEGNLISVNSCFGGLAFYKRKFIKGCRYASKDGDCEHVYFHECIKKKHAGRIFMNPSQITIYSHIYY